VEIDRRWEVERVVVGGREVGGSLRISGGTPRLGDCVAGLRCGFCMVRSGDVLLSEFHVSGYLNYLGA
jgi:hypothetical protein